MGSGNFFEKARTPSFLVIKFMNVTEIAKLNRLTKKKEPMVLAVLVILESKKARLRFRK